MSEGNKWVVPMYESERGWGAKIDGFAGPFDTPDAAIKFQNDFNNKHNGKALVPDYYILAMNPVPYDGQLCDYKSTV